VIGPEATRTGPIAEAGREAPGIPPVEAIRARFPALRRTHAGIPVAHFDGPGGTQVPRVVADAMSDYLLHHNANARWRFATSCETDAALAEARAALADWVGGAPHEIAFGANMTTLTFHVSRALARKWKAGDAVVVTELDHHANSDSWREAARERQLEVRTVRMRPEDGTLDEEDLERKLAPGARLVALPAASNALGTILDVPRLVERCHAAGALVYVDAVHYAAHLPPDARAWNCDFLVCSPYKFYGPHLGVLWGRAELLAELDAPRLEGADPRPPFGVETGTLCHEGIVGARAAVDFLASLDHGPAPRRERLQRVARVLHERGEALLRRLWEGIGQIARLRRYGPPPGSPRTPTLSMSLDGRPADAVAGDLAARALFLSHGHFQALGVARALGRERDGLLRAGCAAYTTAEEVDRLLFALARPTPC
jgi:cysteine desulfurase family protein (TIGR01976 family)